MKKSIAVLLAVLCVVSLMSVGLSALAADDDTKIYAVIYAKGGVPVMYEPAPTFRYDKPGKVTVSSETPVGIDHDFICWMDKDGNRYYPGDEIYVDGEVKLTPYMVPKTDNDDHTTRVIKAAFQSLIRVLEKAFSAFKNLEAFNAG